MRIAVLGSSKSWHFQDLARAAEGCHEVVPTRFGRIASRVTQDHVAVTSDQQALVDCDAVIVRTMPLGTLEQIVFRMNALAALQSSGVAVINAPRSLETAVDKYLAIVKLREAGLQVPDTIACQTLDDALEAFEMLGGDVVVKPLFGGEGRGIARINDEALARRALGMLIQLGAVIYLQKFIPHRGCDWRLFYVGGRVLGMERRNPHDWRTNVSRGAHTQPLAINDAMYDLATTAANSVGARVAGVDVLPGLDGQLFVLEVNAVPGWRALSAALDVDVAKLVLAETESAVTTCGSPATALR